MYFPNRTSHRSEDSSNRYSREEGRNWDRDDDRRRGSVNEDRRRGSVNEDRGFFNDNRDRDYRRERSRSRSPVRKRRSPEFVSNKLMMTSLPSNVDRDSMNIILSQHGFNPIDVRVIRKNNEMGGMRSFGFIDFETVAEAKKYMRYTNGVLHFDDGFEAKLAFAREDDPNYLADRKTFASTDWSCAKCSINNFNRRAFCFKCGISRQESDEFEEKGYTFVGSQPTDTLLVRELPASSTEYDIMQSFSTYSNIPIQRVHIASSKKYCLVQLRSIEDASYLLSTFNRVPPYIQNCAVIVTFSRTSLNKVLLQESVNAIKSQSGISSDQLQADPINSAALLAANAIQMAQLGRVADPHGRQSISTPVGCFLLYPKPDPRTFQLDAVSQYFYDSNTGFYYDPKTGFYFNSTTQQWCFWCSKFSTYIPVEGPEIELRKKLQIEERALYNQDESTTTAEPAATTSQTEAPELVNQQESEKPKKKKKKEDNGKPKTALDIQKEMDKWAKRRNDEKIKMIFKKSDETSMVAESDNSSFAKTWANEDEEEEQTSSAVNVQRPSLNDNEPDAQAVKEFNAQEYIDYNQLACLLCQRQFKSADILEKHCQKSDLHKNNLAAKLAEFNKDNPVNEPQQYRDRAKERRKKHGIDPGMIEPKGIPDVDTADSSSRANVPLEDSNIGNKLLKSMGWSEGKGLGAKGQGIINPIAAEQRVQGVGLGAANSKAGITHKERIQQATMERFRNIRD